MIKELVTIRKSITERGCGDIIFKGAELLVEESLSILVLNGKNHAMIVREVMQYILFRFLENEVYLEELYKKSITFKSVSVRLEITMDMREKDYRVELFPIMNLVMKEAIEKSLFIREVVVFFGTKSDFTFKTIGVI